MFSDMTDRPSGRQSSNFLDALLAQVHGMDRRVLVNSTIRGQTGLPADQVDRPSVHLRWGLQQMKLRGWRSDDWGLLYENGQLGDGPVCILEAVQAPMDAPGNLHMETPEQFYLRLAFVELGQECPLYLSDWNDRQDSFEAIEEVVNKAIELAESYEATGNRLAWEASPETRMHLFGITEERIAAAKAAQEADAV